MARNYIEHTELTPEIRDALGTRETIDMIDPDGNLCPVSVRHTRDGGQGIIADRLAKGWKLATSPDEVYDKDAVAAAASVPAGATPVGKAAEVPPDAIPSKIPASHPSTASALSPAESEQGRTSAERVSAAEYSTDLAAGDKARAVDVNRGETVPDVDVNTVRAMDKDEQAAKAEDIERAIDEDEDVDEDIEDEEQKR